MNSKIIGIIILIVAIGGSSTYFLTKNDSVDTSIQSSYQNEKIGLVINTINPPENIDDLEKHTKLHPHLELEEQICIFIGITLNQKKENLIGV